MPDGRLHWDVIDALDTLVVEVSPIYEDETAPVDGAMVRAVVDRHVKALRSALDAAGAPTVPADDTAGAP